MLIRTERVLATFGRVYGYYINKVSKIIGVVTAKRVIRVIMDLTNVRVNKVITYLKASQELCNKL